MFFRKCKLKVSGGFVNKKNVFLLNRDKIFRTDRFQGNRTFGASHLAKSASHALIRVYPHFRVTGLKIPHLIDGIKKASAQTGFTSAAQDLIDKCGISAGI